MNKFKTLVLNGMSHELPRELAACEYLSAWVEPFCEDVPMVLAEPYESGTDGKNGKNEGKENGSVVGCNLNNWNPRASVRTVNGNNHAANQNDNYAGAFAVISGRNTENIGKNLTSCPARTNTTEGSVAIGGQGRCDYGSLLPFWNDGEDKAESNAIATEKERILKELKTANSKRKLKNLRYFFVNRDLIEKAFDRTMERTHCAKHTKKSYINSKAEICERIYRELDTMTYQPKRPVDRVIHKRGKGDKDRNAKISDMYDRIVQNLMLIVIERKFRNMMIRNVYSGIEERSMLSNNKTYCMVNIIRHWVATHPDSWVGMTDIRHFYENLRMKVVFGIIFKTIVCPYARWLLITMFQYYDRLPIGGSLSQIMAMITLNDCDREILSRYHVFFCCFGDNRLMGGDKASVRMAMEFQMAYYESALQLEVKGDYQIRKVKDGFRFCKIDYHGSFTHVRAEIRRRSIRAWRKGKQHYAGYYGMLKKTDSKYLVGLIEKNYMEVVNKHGMRVTTQNGDKLKLRDVPDGSIIIPVDYRFEVSKKRNEDRITEMKAQGATDAEIAALPVNYFVQLTYIELKPNGDKRLCHSNEGSEEIVEFFKLVANGEELHQKLTVGHEGNKTFFKEYHISKEEACDYICKQLGI